ncbi:tripartite motif-containing protein 2-like [Strongylocentrotus purpuratus]|uniref:Uncharacterized protein n=1 Tax=Strongylocentrotus purpuratus TaxID=7668 RepID=A0A7M7P4D9_STRPU|nr:tripartite motif-containing protein 2-like [Strongylocentrotus purpuratus]
MSEFVHRISRNLQCPVCLELLSDPKQLSCTHTFCKKCLDNILKSSSQNSLTCPICRSETSVTGGNVMNLNTNVPLKSLIDEVINSQQVCELCDSNSRAVHFCCECGKNMCSTCLENHNKWPAQLQHRVVRIEDVREGRVILENEVYCQEHKADKQKYICTDVCVTCKKFICLRCRLLDHENKGHTVQKAKDYNASTKTQIESLQARGETKITAIKNHLTCIMTQKKRVTDHIADKKADNNKSYQESLKKLNERKAESDKQLETQEVRLCKSLDEMQDVDERFITSIESASLLAGNCMKAPLEGDIIVIRDTLSCELEHVLGRADPENKLATDVADHAEQITSTPKCQLNFGQLQKKPVGIVMVGFLIVVACILLTRNNRSDQLNIGEVRVVKCVSVCDVELSKKDCMNGMATTPDGRMAVGSRFGGIDIFSADGPLQRTVLEDVNIRDVGYLSDSRHVVVHSSNVITMYTQEYEKLDVTFDTLSTDEGIIGSLTVDSNDLIYVSYWKVPKRILVFSPAGGKAIREIPCHGYTPEQITSYNDLLIIKDSHRVRIIDKHGNVKHKEELEMTPVYAAVTQNNSILIARVKHADGLVSIDKYTSELKHVKTLISDHKIENPDKRRWYYMREFRSGEIAFCTPDRLYIFKLTTTPCRP